MKQVSPLAPVAHWRAVALGRVSWHRLPGIRPANVAAPADGHAHFANAEIEVVARTMAAMTGRNLVIDPRQGQLNLSTDRLVSPAAAFEQFTAALWLQDFSAGRSPRDCTRSCLRLSKTAGPDRAGRVSCATAGGQIVTQIFRLQPRERQQPLSAVLRPADQPEQHQRHTGQQRAGDHRLRRQACAGCAASSARSTPAPPATST